MPMTSKQMIKLLLKNNFIVLRKNGSHVIMRNIYTNKQTVVPLHNKDLTKGLETAILKQAGIQ